MAPKLHAANLDSLKPPPQWGEREVRRLLRGLRRPHTLETEPLAHFLCDAYGIDRPYDASLHFVGDTFVDRGLVGKRLHDLVRTCDIEASETLLGAASGMGVSPRQFFRYRHEAIVALVAHANKLGLAHPAATSPVEQLARLLGETDPSAASRVYDLAAPAESASVHRVETLLNAGAFFDDAVLDRFRGTERLRILISSKQFALAWSMRSSKTAKYWSSSCCIYSTYARCIVKASAAACNSRTKRDVLPKATNRVRSWRY
jgi:hypothetical protein